MSIKLNKEKYDKENIKTLIKQSLLNKTYETEVIIGGNMHLGSNITYDQFKRIFNRIRGKSQFKESSEQHKLVITFENTTKFKDLRLIINGFNAINAFCINERLDKINSSIVFEKKSFVNETINKVVVNNYNFKINQKNEEKIDVDNALIRDCMKSWKDLNKIYRYKKIYKFYTLKDNQVDLFSIDCSVVRNSSFDDVMMSKYDVGKKDLFNNVVKPKDDKRQFIEWWQSLKGNDMVQVRNIQTYHKTLKASKCFEADLEYELEIEFHQEKILNYYKSILNLEDNSKLKTYDSLKKLMLDLNNEQRNKIIDYIFSLFFENIGLCLQCCQTSFYLLANNEMYTLIKDYKKLTNQKGGIETLFFGPLPIDLNLENTIQYHNDIINKGLIPSIIYDYSVSEKIDGERCLLYIANDGECYLIERNGDVMMRKMGLTMPNYLKNTVMDGEYIEYDKAGDYLNKLYIFDCYFYEGKNIMNYPFSTNKGKTDSERLFFLNKVVNIYKDGTGIKTVNTELKKSIMNFKLDKVSFYFGESSETDNDKRRPELIFQYCNELLNKMNIKYGGLLEEGHLFSYATDGLIFTPCLKGVFDKYNYNSNIKEYSNTTTTIKNINKSKLNINNNDKTGGTISKINSKHVDNVDNVDNVGNSGNKNKKYVKNNKLTESFFKTTYGKKWDSFFKWKSKDYLTMDLEVSIIKKNNSNTRHVHYENNKSYAIINLMCNNYFKNNFLASKNNMCAITSNHNRNLSKELKLIQLPSINPSFGIKQEVSNGIVFNDILNQCYLPISTLYEDEIRCENNDIIYNKNVVEFKYDINESNDMMRWKPLKVRHGKKANALNTCLDIWQLMNLSLDANTIINYEATEEFVNKYKSQLLMNNIYLSYNFNNNFNNGINGINGINGTNDNVNNNLVNMYQILMNGVYDYIITNNSTTFSNPIGMIFGCGNMSDFETYINCKFSRLICFDNNSRVLNDKDYGAGFIISKYQSESARRLKYNTLLITCDLSYDITDPLLENNLVDNKHIIDSRNNYYLDIIYGRHRVSDIETKKLKRFENLGVEGVHLIIGGINILNKVYENEEKLNNFINNISFNLQDQGIFITTFIDGFKVCELLNTLKNNEIYVIKDKSNDESLYEFKPVKDINYELTDGNITNGIEYLRYIKGLSSYQTEYAVDSIYLEKLCMEKGLKVIECRTLTDEPSSYYNEVVLLNRDKLGDKFNSDDLLDYFKMCKTFILQKDNTLLSDN